MEEIKFVYPATEIHELYRRYTKNCNLEGKGDCAGYFKIRNDLLNPRMAGFKDGWPANYSNSEKESVFWHCGGLHLGVEGCSDFERPLGICIYPSRNRASPTAFEAIIYGVGLLRKQKSAQTLFQACIGEEATPKVISDHGKVLLYHFINHHYTKEELESHPHWESQEVYESTNYIYGDSYGELEQLLNRRTDSSFLKAYLNMLKKNNFLLYVMEKYEKAWKNHIKLGIWRNPPASIEELITRVEFILENTFIDKKAHYTTTDYAFHNFMEEHKTHS